MVVLKFHKICFSVGLLLSIVLDLYNLHASALHFLKSFLNCVLKTSSCVSSPSEMSIIWTPHLLDWASHFLYFLPFFSLCQFPIEFFHHKVQSFYLVFHFCYHVVTSSKLDRLLLAKCFFYSTPVLTFIEQKSLPSKRLTVGIVSVSSRFKILFIGI